MVSTEPSVWESDSLLTGFFRDFSVDPMVKFE